MPPGGAHSGSMPNIASSASMPGAPPGPAKKGNTGMIIGAVLGVAVLGGGGFAAYKLLLSGENPLPFAATALPEETFAVRKNLLASQGASELGVEAGDIPKQAMWSGMADLCGGSDIFPSLLRGKDKYAQKAIGKAIAKKDDTAKYLQCGREIAQSLKGKAFYGVSWKEKKESRRVTLVPIALDELSDRPPHVKSSKVLDGFDTNYCFLSKSAKEDDDCEDKAKGMGKLTGQKFWAIGDTEDLKAWGDAFSADGKNSGKEADALAEMAAKVKSFEGVQLGTFESFPSGLGFTFHASVSIGGSEHGKKVEEKLEKLVKDDEPYWAVGETFNAKGGSVELFAKAGSESDAKDLAEGIKDYLDEVIDEADKREDKEKDSDTDDDTPKVEREYQKARRTMAMRALKKAITYDQSAEWVHVTVKFEPEKDETSAIEDFQKDRKEHLETASKVIDALIEGDAPDKDLLKDLGGSDLVDAVDKAKDEKDEDDAPKAPPPPEVTTEAVSRIVGFVVPSGGTHTTEPVSGKTMDEYAYVTSDPVDLVTRFKTGLSAAGWTVTMKTDAKGLAYECVRAESTVIALITKDPSGNMVISVLQVR